MSNLSSVFNHLRWARPQAPAHPERGLVGVGEAPSHLLAALDQMELLVTGDRPRIGRLPSSDHAVVYHAELAWGPVCVKQALVVPGAGTDPAAAPARSAYETRWLRYARDVVPASAPEVIAELPSAGLFVMEYLDPERYPSWVQVLEGDRIQPWIAAEIGHLLGRLHAASANSAAIAQCFRSASSFRALCIEPRLVRPLAPHADCASALQPLIGSLGETRVALVHGAFAPNNVLVGPRGPVVIDADCATYADPIFDFATMLADLAMWMLRRPSMSTAYLACFDTFARTYLPHVTWEMTSNAEARAARLVPALLLGLIDGDRRDSRVVDAAAEARARQAARSLVLEPLERLEDLRDAWRTALDAPAAVN